MILGLGILSFLAFGARKPQGHEKPATAVNDSLDHVTKASATTFDTPLDLDPPNPESKGLYLQLVEHVVSRTPGDREKQELLNIAYLMLAVPQCQDQLDRAASKHVQEHEDLRAATRILDEAFAADLSGLKPEEQQLLAEAGYHADKLREIADYTNNSDKLVHIAENVELLKILEIELITKYFDQLKQIMLANCLDGMHSQGMTAWNVISTLNRQRRNLNRRKPRSDRTKPFGHLRTYKKVASILDDLHLIWNVHNIHSADVPLETFTKHFLIGFGIPRCWNELDKAIDRLESEEQTASAFKFIRSCKWKETLDSDGQGRLERVVPYVARKLVDALSEHCYRGEALEHWDMSELYDHPIWLQPFEVNGASD